MNRHRRATSRNAGDVRLSEAKVAAKRNLSKSPSPKSLHCAQHKSPTFPSSSSSFLRTHGLDPSLSTPSSVLRTHGQVQSSTCSSWTLAVVVAFLGLLVYSQTHRSVICNGTQLYPFCVCAPGQGLDFTLVNFWQRSQCSSCRKNEYKSSSGNVACTPCPLYEESTNIGRTRCRACKPGHTRQRNEKGRASSSHDSPCRPCHKNSYLPHPTETCRKCPANTFSQEGSTQCKPCQSGYWRESFMQDCMPCPENTFFNETSGTCAACQLDSVSLPGSVSCSPCPSAEVRPAGKATCRPCDRNLFKSPHTPGVCLTCGPFAFTTGPGKAFPKDCNCLAGATRAVSAPGAAAAAAEWPSFSEMAQLLCVRCPEGHFKNVTGDGPCLLPREGYTVNEARDKEVLRSSWERARAYVKNIKLGHPLFDLTVGGIAQVGTWVTLSAASLLDTSFREVLEKLYRIGWENEEDFEREFNASGGAGNSSSWGAAEKDIPQHKRVQPCPFEDKLAVWEFVKNSDLFKGFLLANTAASVKSLGRKLVLEYHVSASTSGPLASNVCALSPSKSTHNNALFQPDRFNDRFRACNDNLSQFAFIEIMKSTERLMKKFPPK